MAIIDEKTQTYERNGQRIDVKTGQPVASTPTPPAPSVNNTPYQTGTGTPMVIGNPGINPGLAAVGTAGAQANQGINRTVLDGGTPTPTSAAEQFLNTFQAPETREQIVERRRRESQDLIGSINRTYDDEVRRKQEIGQERLSIDNAASVMSGLMGSTPAGESRKKTLDANEQEVQAVNNRRAMELNAVYSDINAAADLEAREQLADATRNAEQIVERRQQTQQKAMDSLKLMAQGGLVDFDSFRSSPQNEKVYNYALEAVGGSEEALKAMFLLNRPQDQIIGTPQRIGNQFMQAYQNPITGKVNYEALDLPIDLPTEYNTFQKLGDNLVAVPDGWDGDTSKLVTVAGQPSQEDLLRRTLLQEQVTGARLSNEKTSRELSAVDTGELTPKQVSTAIQLSNSLKTHPAYTDMSDISTGMQGVRVGLSQKNGFGDITAINAFQRMVDPGATVREGDVALLQTASAFIDKTLSDYPIEKLRKGDKLPDAVRERMRKTAEDLYQLRAKNYNDTIGNQYKSLAGSAKVPFEMVGADFSVEEVGKSQRLADPNGNPFDASALSPEEYEAALADGFTPLD